MEPSRKIRRFAGYRMRIRLPPNTIWCEMSSTEIVSLIERPSRTLGLFKVDQEPADRYLTNELTGGNSTLVKHNISARWN